jgi:hypothetical protein
VLRASAEGLEDEEIERALQRVGLSLASKHLPRNLWQEYRRRQTPVTADGLCRRNARFAISIGSSSAHRLVAGSPRRTRRSKRQNGPQVPRSSPVPDGSPDRRHWGAIQLVCTRFIPSLMTASANRVGGSRVASVKECFTSKPSCSLIAEEIVGAAKLCRQDINRMRHQDRLRLARRVQTACSRLSTEHRHRMGRHSSQVSESTLSSF